MNAPRREDLIRALPYARRYARALSGSAERGDALVADSLRALLSSGQAGSDARLDLYHAVTRSFPTPDIQNEPATQIPIKDRQLLLLTSLEELDPHIAAEIVGIDRDQAHTRLEQARISLRRAISADVLIIEDEPIIAMDIEELVTSSGHRVVGVASTESEAVTIAAQTKPTLILADINLGLGGDGTSAVTRILREHYAPVIFVTAYPERLLTGEALEPAFVITKPFEPTTLAIATYQAVTGGVRLDR